MLKKYKHLTVKFLVVVGVVPVIIWWLSNNITPANISSGDRSLLYSITGLILSVLFLNLYDRFVLRINERMQVQIEENKRGISEVKYELTILKSIISSELGVPYSEVKKHVKVKDEPVIVSHGDEEE